MLVRAWQRAALLILPLLIAVPATASAAAPKTFLELSSAIVQLLDNATAVLITAGIVIYFYGVSSNLIKARNGEAGEMRAYLAWGIGIIFVMVSIWGILQLLQHTLFGGSNGVNAPAQSAPNCNSFGTCTFRAS